LVRVQDAQNLEAGQFGRLIGSRKPLIESSSAQELALLATHLRLTGKREPEG
jgi:hypothetical protein